MKKFLVAAAAAGLLAVSSMAALADQASGAITTVDASAMTVTLADGNTYQLPKDVDAASLKVGDKITVEFTKQSDGSMVATTVTPQS